MNNTKHKLRTLPHHRLRIYGTARALRRLVASNPIGDANLRRHASEAASSVVLIIGEGAALWGAAKKRHYRIAFGSALEVAAAYEAAGDCGERLAVAEIFEHVDHVAVMTKLTRR